MSDGLCAVRFCRKNADLTVLGIPFCQKHWEAHCEGQELVLCDGQTIGILKPPKREFRF